MSVNSSSLDSRSKGPRDVGPSGGAGSVLGGSVTGVAVWLEEASSWLAVGSSLSSSACGEGLHPAFSHLLTPAQGFPRVRELDRLLEL